MTAGMPTVTKPLTIKPVSTPPASSGPSKVLYENLDGRRGRPYRPVPLVQTAVPGVGRVVRSGGRPMVAMTNKQFEALTKSGDIRQISEDGTRSRPSADIR